jgi:hypothetical protein
MSDNLDAPAPASVQDKIAAKFGFPSAADEGTHSAIPAAAPAEAAAPDADLFELEWEGAKYSVPAKLKDGFMRNEDYTRKTQELSEQRKSLEQSRELANQSQLESAFNASVADEMREIALRDAYLSRVKGIDWAAMNTDQMLRQKHEIDVIKEERDNLKQSVSDKRAKFSDDMKAKFSELRAKSRELAAKSIPGFSEETDKEIRKAAASEGLTDQEIDNVLLDPRSAKILWKAAQYDKVKAGTAQAVDAATAKVIKPGASNEKMPQKVIDNFNFKKAMSKAVTSGEKANLIEQKLQGVFAKGIS